jgi:hypothetical protein
MSHVKLAFALLILTIISDITISAQNARSPLLKTLRSLPSKLESVPEERNDESDPIVTIDNGQLRGKVIATKKGECNAFIGVPFAEPPTGDLHWKVCLWLCFFTQPASLLTREKKGKEKLRSEYTSSIDKKKRQFLVLKSPTKSSIPGGT